MRYTIGKSCRFVWRFARNVACTSAWGRNLLFPSESLAQSFGSDDAEYAIEVFLHHYQQLSAARFHVADKIMEVGPGRNLGTSILMWALNQSRCKETVTVILWDVFPNMTVDSAAVRAAARTMLNSRGWRNVADIMDNTAVEEILNDVASGKITPSIHYFVRSLRALDAHADVHGNGLVYSHAVIEHIWDPSTFWKTMVALTKSGGWHSHRIDLADHGRRETNYLEMLEWSKVAYWITMRFIPGALNQWRMSEHLECVREQGLRILSVHRQTRDALPGPITRLARRFRSFDELDLRTAALDFVATKVATEEERAASERPISLR